MTNPAPITNPISDEQGLPTLPWVLFFNQTFEGDPGTAFAPSFVSLTEVGGSATITGRYYRISQFITYFRVDIVPATNTSATAGTTYVDNFPLDITFDGFCTVVAGVTGGAIGKVDASTNRVYVPAWTSVTTKVTVLGICEAR